MLHRDVQVGDTLGPMTLDILEESPPEQRAPQFASCADAHCGLGNDSQSSSAVFYQLKLEE